MKAKHILLCCALCLVIGLITGFFAGRHTIEQPESVKYIAEKPVAGTVAPLKPVRVEIPAMPLLIMRTDTVYVDQVAYTREVVDTAAIIANYELKRFYETRLFDNQYGKLDLSLSTQYNQLGALSYVFTPITKTVYRERIWRPFVSATYGSLGYIGAGGGLYYKSVGVSVQYTTNLQKNGFEIEVFKMF
jgi:hypothetical protein